MCSIRNLFNTNIRKFDAKFDFICPECLECITHYEKLIFFNKNKISVLEVKFLLKKFLH